jgi:hypothetical protein
VTRPDLAALEVGAGSVGTARHDLLAWIGRVIRVGARPTQSSQLPLGCEASRVGLRPIAPPVTLLVVVEPTGCLIRSAGYFIEHRRSSSTRISVRAVSEKQQW